MIPLRGGEPRIHLKRVPNSSRATTSAARLKKEAGSGLTRSSCAGEGLVEPAAVASLPATAPARPHRPRLLPLGEARAAEPRFGSHAETALPQSAVGKRSHQTRSRAPSRYHLA